MDIEYREVDLRRVILWFAEGYDDRAKIRKVEYFVDLSKDVVVLKLFVDNTQVEPSEEVTNANP